MRHIYPRLDTKTAPEASYCIAILVMQRNKKVMNIYGNIRFNIYSFRARLKNNIHQCDNFLSSAGDRKEYTVKKVIGFPVPSWDITGKTITFFYSIDFMFYADPRHQ